VQVYEILFLVLLGFLVSRPTQRARSMQWPEGARFRIFLGGYLLWRFAIDFMKPQPLLAGLNLIQWSCVAGLFLLVAGEMRSLKGKHEPVRA
jgi:phosphatidylglycerol:prolipoprotein diacylglycerol transferase